MNEPCLFIVATPIGCLRDMSDRAREALVGAELIVAEDTRTTRKLLTAFGIKTPEMVSYYDGAELIKAQSLAERIKRDGLKAALVSEAGTPAISDPGYQLVRCAHSLGIRVVPIPGASAPIALVSASGLPSDRLLFLGFLPTKAKELEAEVRSWYGAQASVVFLESGRRIQKTLELISQVFPGVSVAIGRELTKVHEEIIVAEIEEARIWCQTAILKGEFTVMVSRDGLRGKEEAPGDDLDQILRGDIAAGLSVKDMLRRHRDAGLGRTELYQRILVLKIED